MFRAAVLMLGIGVLVSGMSACSETDEKTRFRLEAEAVCEVFNPNNWKDISKDIQPYELQAMLTERLTAALKSEQMAEIFRALPQFKIDKAYDIYQKKVSELIGEKHECPAIKDYFSVNTDSSSA